MIGAPQVACDRCTQGVMDQGNPHLHGRCPCPCHASKARPLVSCREELAAANRVQAAAMREWARMLRNAARVADWRDVRAVAVELDAAATAEDANAPAFRSWARRLRTASEPITIAPRARSWASVESVVREIIDAALDWATPEGEAP